MANLQLLNIIEEILGSGKTLKKGDVAFFCPFCNHHKRKLQVNLETFKYHCWVCGSKGRSIWSLFKKLDVTDKHFTRLKTILGDSYTQYTSSTTSDYKEVLKLPPEFISLSHQNMKDPFYRNALNYAKNRRIKLGDILKYNIGYCDSGNYAGRLIIPSYDQEGNLNYFVGRSYTDSPLKYKNPPVTRNIIGFENLINWSAPITLVEGVMDAIAVGRNAIPMFGKYMSRLLRERIATERVSRIYIALDPDALDSAVKLGEYYHKNDIEIHILDCTQKDPSEMGTANIQKLLSNSTPLDMGSLIQLKLR